MRGLAVSSRRGGLFPWPLTFCCVLCARSSRHPVRSFDTIYHPTDFTVMNETQILCCICYMDNKERKKKKKTHYRCKAEIFFSCFFFFFLFPPQLYFFTPLRKVVFFNVSRTFNSDAKLGAATSVPSEHKTVRLIFLRFYQKVFNDGTTFSFCFLNCTTVPLYYILRIKTLILLWRSGPFLVSLHTWCWRWLCGSAGGPYPPPPPPPWRFSRMAVFLGRVTFSNVPIRRNLWETWSTAFRTSGWAKGSPNPPTLRPPQTRLDRSGFGTMVWSPRAFQLDPRI